MQNIQLFSNTKMVTIITAGVASLDCLDLGPDSSPEGGAPRFRH